MIRKFGIASIIVGILILFSVSYFIDFLGKAFGILSMLFGLSLLFFGISLIASVLEKNRRLKIKKYTLYTSIILVFTAIVFSLIGFPGVAPLIILGVLIYSFIFSPLELQNKYIKWHPYSKSTTEVVLLSAIDFLGLNFIALGALAKFMHWPYADIMLIIGICILTIGLLSWNYKFKKEVIYRKISEDKLKVQHKEITDSINYAERIQYSFLATKHLLDGNLNDYFVFFQPKDVVSGDFYWADKLNNGHFAIVNADSTGHGVPGAIMSILNISSIESAVKEKLTEPADIFNHTRKTIIERLKKDGSVEGGKDGMDASLISFNTEKTKMEYVAAHNPIWIIRNKELIDIKGEKMPVGKYNLDHIPFKGGEFDLQKGDIIYSLTDGFQDQFGGEKGKKFKVKPFKRLLLEIAHLPMKEQHLKISETFDNWKGDIEQVDDVCVIGIKI